MKNILFLYLAYPMTIAGYLRTALEKRHDVKITTCGVFTNDFIPWSGGMRLPMKYVKPVDLALPQSITAPAWQMLENRIGKDFDLIINVDAGFHLSTKPPVPYALVLTDPHVLTNTWYSKARPIADFVFNMQRYYMMSGDIHLPYCFSPDHHYALSCEKEYDASLIGLHYQQRDILVRELRARGRKVLYDIGLVYDEYREWNNKAKIGLNWSSLMDINARTFEIMAMKQIPVMNRLPHLEELGFEEGRQYLGFENVQEAVEKCEWALMHESEANAIALSAYNAVQKHTYDARIEQIFEAVGI